MAASVNLGALIDLCLLIRSTSVESKRGRSTREQLSRALVKDLLGLVIPNLSESRLRFKEDVLSRNHRNFRARANVHALLRISRMRM